MPVTARYILKHPVTGEQPTGILPDGLSLGAFGKRMRHTSAKRRNSELEKIGSPLRLVTMWPDEVEGVEAQ